VNERNPLPESIPIPTLLAFLMCESVIHDAETQKKTLVGVFDRLLSSSAPLQVAGLGLYAKLVEGHGNYTFKIRMVNLKDESLVLDISTPANWSRAEAPLEFGVNFRGVPIPAFGDYEFQLFANDIYVGRAVFKVEKMQLPPSAPPAGRG
jgi:hypothetical protein